MRHQENSGYKRGKMHKVSPYVFLMLNFWDQTGSGNVDEVSRCKRKQKYSWPFYKR